MAERGRLKGLSIVLAVLTTVMMTLTAIPDYAYADDGEDTCRVTIKVIDDSTGEEIKDAAPEVYKVGEDEETWHEVDTQVNAESDGTFVLTAEDYLYRYKAKADGYKYTHRNSYGNDEYGDYVDFSGKTQDSDGNYTMMLTVRMTPEAAEDKLAEKKTEAKKALNSYKSSSDYDDEGQTELTELINTYSDQIDKAENEDAVSKALTEGKVKIDKIKSAQEKNNDQYADKILFTTRDGESKKILTGGNGHYTAKLSLLDRGGVFSVDGDLAARWSAKKDMFYSKQQHDITVDYIAGQTGSFLDYSSIPDELEFTDTEIQDASVTLSDGSKVTFDLVVSTSGTDKEAAVKTVRDQIASIGEVTIKSEDAVKAARKAYDGLPRDLQSEIDNYDKLKKAESSLEEVKKQDAADAESAKALDEKISAIGDVTLNSGSAIKEARSAYDALDSNAKAKVTSYDTLKAAEDRLSELKDSEIRSLREQIVQLKEQLQKALLPSKASLKAKAGKRQVALTWTKTFRAKGYQIYRSTSRNGKYTKIKTVKSGKTVRYVNRKLKKGRVYYYKACAYNSYGQGTMSEVRKVKVK